MFSNPHQYGKSLNVHTHSDSCGLQQHSDYVTEHGFKNEVTTESPFAFDPQIVKDQLGIPFEVRTVQRMLVKFLAKKRVNWIKRFSSKKCPNRGQEQRLKTYACCPRTAKTTMRVSTQPGVLIHDQACNAVKTRSRKINDHELGRNADTRMQLAWFGANQSKKLRAMNLALEMAEVA